jgi:hypothetical protein
MKRAIILVCFMVFACSSAFLHCSCSQSQRMNEKKESTLPTAKEMPKPPIDLKLTSVLYELAITPDKEMFAKEHDIFVSKDRVRVYISLDLATTQSQEEKLVETYNMLVEKKSMNLFRALVPIDKLIPLSKESHVWSIRLPDRPLQ